MKILLSALTLVSVLLSPLSAFAATQSASFVAASQQYLRANDSASLSATGNLTIEGWFKFTTTPSSGNLFNLAGKWQSAGNSLSYLAQLQNAGGTLGIRFINSSTGSNVGLATVNWSPSTATWYHIAVVYTASSHQIELFVDGASQGTATGTLLSSIADTGSVFIIGEDGDISAGQYLDGQAFLVRMWSTTRSGAQLSSSWCTLLGSTGSLGGEWSLDNTLNDNSGNSNTLTNVNSVTFTSGIPSLCSTPSTFVPSFFESFWW